MTALQGDACCDWRAAVARRTPGSDPGRYSLAARVAAEASLMVVTPGRSKRPGQRLQPSRAPLRAGSLMGASRHAVSREREGPAVGGGVLLAVTRECRGHQSTSLRLWLIVALKRALEPDIAGDVEHHDALWVREAWRRVAAALA